MLRKIALAGAALSLAGGITLAIAHSNYSGGPDPSHTGAPETGSAPQESNCTRCHYLSSEGVPMPNLNLPGGQVEILDLPNYYETDQAYVLRVRLDSDSTRTNPTRRWGFQITAVRKDNGEGVGTFELSDPDSLQIVAAFSFEPWTTRSYVEHTSLALHQGEAGPVEWSFRWRAPSTYVGTVLFCVAGNAANGSGDFTGDFIYTHADSLRDMPTPALRTSWGGVKRRWR
jgi:hypothetical protein